MQFIHVLLLHAKQHHHIEAIKHTVFCIPQEASCIKSHACSTLFSLTEWTESSSFADGDRGTIPILCARAADEFSTSVLNSGPSSSATPNVYCRWLVVTLMRPYVPLLGLHRETMEKPKAEQGGRETVSPFFSFWPSETTRYVPVCYHGS